MALDGIEPVTTKEVSFVIGLWEGVFFPLINDFRPAGRLMGISIAANRKRPDSLSKVDVVITRGKKGGHIFFTHEVTMSKNLLNHFWGKDL